MIRMVIIYGSSDSERWLLDKLPNKVHSIDDMHKVREDFKRKHASVSGRFTGLKRWTYRRQIGKIDRGTKDPLRVGAFGEKGVLDTLAVLDDSYHVFCVIWTPNSETTFSMFLHRHRSLIYAPPPMMP